MVNSCSLYPPASKPMVRAVPRDVISSKILNLCAEICFKGRPKSLILIEALGSLKLVRVWKIKNGVPLRGPSHSTSWSLLCKKASTIMWKDICTSFLEEVQWPRYGSNPKSKIWKQSKYPMTDKCIKILWYTMEYYATITKDEIMQFSAMRIELESVMLNISGQSKKVKYQMSSFICEIETKQRKRCSVIFFWKINEKTAYQEKLILEILCV